MCPSVLPCCSPCPTPICGSGWSPAGPGTSPAPPASPATSAGSSHLETAKTTFTPVILHTVHSCHQPTDVWRWMFWIVCGELLKNLKDTIVNCQINKLWSLWGQATSKYYALHSTYCTLHSEHHQTSLTCLLQCTLLTSDCGLDLPWGGGRGRGWVEAVLAGGGCGRGRGRGGGAAVPRPHRRDGRHRRVPPRPGQERVNLKFSYWDRQIVIFPGSHK